jgi:uncharacterized repeat protein (TIGR01451 family)
MQKLRFWVGRSRGSRGLAAAFSLSLLLTLAGPAASALALVSPTATTPSFSPPTPRTSQTVTASSIIDDVELTQVHAHFAWSVTRGGVTCPVRQFDSAPTTSPMTHSDSLDLASATVSAVGCSGGSDLGTINISRGDTITVEVTPVDGGGSGSPKSASTIVANTPPALASVSITESSPATSDTLHTTLGATSDDDGDGVTVAYQWQRNSGSDFQNIPGETGPALDLSKPGNGNKGNSIRVIATPTDGTDGGGPATSSAVVIGNSTPVAGAQSVSTDEDTTKTIPLTASDADVPDDVLILRVSSLPAHGDLYDGAGTGGHHIAPGEVPYAVTDAGGNVTYVPNPNFSGPDSFTFNASDGTPSANATVSITVNPVNDNPVANNDGPVSIAGGDTASVDVVVNDTPGGGADEAPQTLTVTQITASPAHGAGSIVSNKVQYTPDSAYVGADSLDYRVCDSGTPQGCSTATVSFNVTAAVSADVSVAKGGPAEVKAGATFNYTITVANAGPAAALNVQVADVLPAGLEFQSADNGGVYTAGNNTVAWSLGTRPPGSPIVLTLTVKASGTALVAFDNTATATTASTDPVGTNNSSTAHTTIQRRDIVFVSNRDGGDQDIFEMYLDGTGQVNVTPGSPSCDRYPAWSPDGTKIAFSSTRATSPTAACAPGSGAANSINAEIYVMNADGTNVTSAITSAPGLDVQPTWSPDGTEIAYSSQGTTAKFSVFKTASNGLGTPVKLTNKPCNDGTRGCSPDWSPDGSTIAFVRACANVKNCPTTAEIFTMAAAAPSALTRLTSNAVDEGSPTWSPNGARLLLWRYDGKDNEIAMMNPNGTRQTFLTADPASDVDPAWLPGGSQIVYSSNRTSNSEVTFRDLAAPGAVPNLTNDLGADTDPDYRAA